MPIFGPGNFSVGAGGQQLVNGKASTTTQGVVHAVGEPPSQTEINLLLPSIEETMARTGQTRQDIEIERGLSPLGDIQSRARQFAQQLPQPEPTIVPSQLEQARGVEIPGVTGDGGDSFAKTMVAGAETSLSQIIQQLTPPETAVDIKQQGFLDDIASLTGELAQQSADQLTAEQSAGLPDLRAEFAAINAQILEKSARYRVLQEENKGKPITMSSILGADRAILNAEAADIGLLTAQALGLQGRIADAQASVDRSIDLKYQTISNQLAVKQAQLNAIQPLLNKQERVQAQAQQVLLNRQQQELSERKANDKQIQSIMLDLASNGASQDLISRASNASTVTEAAQIFSEFARSQQAIADGDGQPAIVLPTFEDFIASEEATALQSFSPEKRESLRAEFDQQVALAQAVPSDISRIVEGVNNGVFSAATALTNIKNTDAKRELLVALSSVPTKSDTSAQLAAKQKVTLIDEIISSPGMGESVGATKFTRVDLNPFTGAKENFISGVQQLTSQDTLNTLIELKKAGGTLGALSNEERIMLKNAATKISNWEIPNKKGKIVGYDIDQKAFKKELEKLKSLANTAVTNSIIPINRTTEDGASWIQNVDGSFTNINQ